MKIYIYISVSLIWGLCSDVTSYMIRHKLVQIESCPDLGFFMENDTNLSFGHNVCNLCFCKQNGSAVCWERETYKCFPNYTLETARFPRSKRSPFSWTDLFGRETSTPKNQGYSAGDLVHAHDPSSLGIQGWSWSDFFGYDTSKPAVITENIQECQPYESSYSEGCPPEDWCVGCTVCDCTAEGRWDCHLLSFCGDGDNKKVNKEMLSKIPHDVLETIDKKLTEKAITTQKQKIVPKPTPIVTSTRKLLLKRQIKKKFLATMNSTKTKAKFNSKKGIKLSSNNVSLYSELSTMTRKPALRKIMKRLPKGLVTVKPPVSEMKTITYIDKVDNSTVKKAKMMIQKIYARLGENFKLMINNSNANLPPWKQAGQESGITRTRSSRKKSAKRPKKREIYKNHKYRSKRSNNLGDITLESHIVPYTEKPLSLRILQNNVTDKANTTDDITTEINNYTKYQNTIINSNSEVVVVNDTITSSVWPQSLDIKNISDLMPEEKKIHALPLRDSGVDEYPMNSSIVNNNITEPNFLIIVANVTSTIPTIPTLKSKYKPMSRKSSIFTDNIYLMPSFIKDLKLKIHLLKMLYGVNEILPKQKSYEINDENNNNYVVDKTIGKSRKCSNIKKEKENKTILICKMFGICNLSNKKLRTLKAKLQSLKSDVLEIMYVISSIKNILKDLELTSGYHKIDRRAYKTFPAADDAAVESFGPPRTHFEIIDSMKREIKYFLKRLDQFTDQFKSAVKELDRERSLSDTVKNENYTTDKTRQTKKVNRHNEKKFVKQLDRLLMKYNLPRNTFLANIAQALYDHDRRTNRTTKLENSRHLLRKDYITSRAYVNKLLHNMRLLKVIAEKLNSTKLREKRQIANEDGTLNYLMTLLDIVMKQKYESKESDGIDSLIEAIKSAPEIKPIRKSSFDLTTVVNSDYVTTSIAPTTFEEVNSEENFPVYTENHSQFDEELLGTATDKPTYVPDDVESTIKDTTVPDTIINSDSLTDSTVSRERHEIIHTSASPRKKTDFYNLLFRLQNNVDEEKYTKTKSTTKKMLITTREPPPSTTEVSVIINDTTNNAVDESASNENIISSRIGIPWAESAEELMSKQENKLSSDSRIAELQQVNATDVSLASGTSEEYPSKDDNDDEYNILQRKQNDLLTSLDYSGSDKVEVEINREEKSEKASNDIFE